MILTTAALLTAFGFVAWISGLVLDYPGIAVIGGVLVVGVGAMVMESGLEYRDGEVRNNTSADTVEITHTYEKVPTPQHLSMGVLTLLLGGVMSLQSINRFGGT